MLRIAIGFIVAPFGGALLQALIFVGWPRDALPFSHPAGAFLGICLFYWILQAVIGTPAIWWLRRRNWDGFLAYAATGLCVYLGPTLVLLDWRGVSRGAPLHLTIIGIASFAVAGLLAGATFWWIARPRRVRDYDEAFG